MQSSSRICRPCGTVVDPLTQHADFVIGETDLCTWHHLGVCAITLDTADEETAISVTWDDVVTPAGILIKGRGFTGEIECRARPAAIVAMQAVILKHRFDLSEEVMISRILSDGTQRA